MEVWEPCLACANVGESVEDMWKHVLGVGESVEDMWKHVLGVGESVEACAWSKIKVKC